MKKITSFLLIVFLLSIFVATPVSAATSAGIKPNSFLYLFDTTFEKVNLFFTFNPEKKAKIALEYANERLAEVETLTGDKDSNIVKTVMENYTANIVLASEKSKEVKDQQVSEKLLSTIVDSASKNQEVLNNVLAKVPEEAKDAILKAIEASKSGQEEAIRQISGLKKEVEQLRKEMAELKRGQEEKSQQDNEKVSSKEVARSEAENKNNTSQSSEIERLKLEISKAKVEAEKIRLESQKLEAEKNEYKDSVPSSIATSPAPLPATFSVSSVVPDKILAGYATNIIIKGSGFKNGAKIDFGSGGVQPAYGVISGTQISVLIPSSMPAVIYDITITNPDGKVAVLKNALAVQAVSEKQEPVIELNKEPISGSIELTSQPETLPADGKSTSLIKALVRDINGNIMPNQVVHFSYNGQTTAIKSDYNGIASFRYIATTNIGSIVISAKLDLIVGNVTIEQKHPGGVLTFDEFVKAEDEIYLEIKTEGESFKIKEIVFIPKGDSSINSFQYNSRYFDGTVIREGSGNSGPASDCLMSNEINYPRWQPPYCEEGRKFFTDSGQLRDQFSDFQLQLYQDRILKIRIGSLYPYERRMQIIYFKAIGMDSEKEVIIENPDFNSIIIK